MIGPITNGGRLNPWLVAGLLPLFIVLLIVHAFYHYPFFIDDTFISLRYAERLLEGKGLTWNDGEYVEGYSNLLWILLSAAFGYAGYALEAAVRALGITSALLTMSVLTWHAHRAQLHLFAWVSAMILFALMPPVAIWMMAGIETCMVMLFIACAAAWCYPLINHPSRLHAVGVGIVLGLLCLLRPEGPIYTIVIALALGLFSTLPMAQRIRMLLLLCGIPLLFFSSQLAFRLYAYGAWFPNTVLVKIAFTKTHMAFSYLYNAKAILSFLPILLYVFFNLYHSWKKSKDTVALRYALFLALSFILLVAAIVIAGGDIFIGFRAYVPLIPLLMLWLMHMLDSGMRLTDAKKELLFLSYVLVAQVWLMFQIDVNQRTQKESWVSHARELGLALKQRYEKTQPLLAVYAAGVVSYYSQLPTLDVYGLNDRGLAQRRKNIEHFGQGMAGHELFQAEYVESKKPDILVFDMPGLYKLCDEEIARGECRKLLINYRQISFPVKDYHVPLWIRKDSTKVH
jgi:arabinofuranosyltransferase